MLHNELTVFVLLRPRTTAAHDSLGTDCDVLLHHCVLDNCLAPGALDVSRVLIADPSMVTDIAHQHFSPADSAFKSAIAALEVVLFIPAEDWLLRASWVRALEH